MTSMSLSNKTSKLHKTSSSGGNSSIYDVAKLAGVSPKTVARVYSKEAHVKDTTRKKVEAAASKLGYSPNMAARTMRTGKTKTVGIILPGLQVAITGLKLEAIEQALSSKGYRSMIIFTEGKGKHVIEALKEMANRRVDGIVLMHDYSLESRQKTEEILVSLENLNIPCVLSHFSSPVEGYDFPSVEIDSDKSMADIAGHLQSNGHKNVAFWSPAVGLDGIRKRNGFVSASSHYDLNVRIGGIDDSKWTDADEFSQQEYKFNISKTVDSITDESWPWTKTVEHKLRHSLRNLFTSSWKPTAIVLSNDKLAMITIDEISKDSWRVPDDIAVIGYDDIDSSRLYNPKLSTVSQPSEEYAEEVANMLLMQIRGEKLIDQHQILNAQFIPRESSANNPSPPNQSNVGRINEAQRNASDNKNSSRINKAHQANQKVHAFGDSFNHPTNYDSNQSSQTPGRGFHCQTNLIPGEKEIL